MKNYQKNHKEEGRQNFRTPDTMMNLPLLFRVKRMQKRDQNKRDRYGIGTPPPGAAVP